MESTVILFYGFLLIVAFLYSSVGHGGASGYLALMAIFSFSQGIARPVALILNLFVSLIAFVQYYRSGHFKWHLFWPFALGSVPAAILGGFIILDPFLYKKILAILLLLSVVKLVGFNFYYQKPLKNQNIYLSLIIGFGIGILSGMIGIGGGIILSPLILLLRWGQIKETAAVSALFIFVNSLAAIMGVYSSGIEFKSEWIIMIIIALIGGMAGSYYGAQRFKSNMLCKILALVLVIASLKLIFT